MNNTNGAPDCPTCGKKAQTDSAMKAIGEHIGKMQALASAATEQQDKANFYLALFVYCLKQAPNHSIRIPASYLNDVESGSIGGFTIREVPPQLKVRNNDVDLILTLGDDEDQSKIIIP